MTIFTGTQFSALVRAFGIYHHLDFPGESGSPEYKRTAQARAHISLRIDEV